MFSWWRTRQLHKAALLGDTTTILRLIGRGTDPNAQSVSGTFTSPTPLHVAMLHSSVAAAKVLLDNGGDVTATCRHFCHFVSELHGRSLEELCSALHLAVEADSIDGIKLLIDHGLPIDTRSSLGRTALHLCAAISCAPILPKKTHSLAVLQTLLDLGACANARDACGRTPLFYASATNGCAKAMKMLLDAGADVNALDEGGQSALFWADGLGVVELLLQRGADHRIRDKQGWTALKCSSITWIHPKKVALLEPLER